MNDPLDFLNELNAQQPKPRPTPASGSPARRQPDSPEATPIQPALPKQKHTTTHKIPCPNCRQTLNVPEKYIGQTAKCPGCHKPFKVELPEPVEEITLADVPLSPAPATSPPRNPSYGPSPQPGGPIQHSVRQVSSTPPNSGKNSQMGLLAGALIAGVYVAAWIFETKYHEGEFGANGVTVRSEGNDGFPNYETTSEPQFFTRCMTFAFAGGAVCTGVLYGIAMLMMRVKQATAAGPAAAQLSVGQKTAMLAVTGGIIGAVLGIAIGVYVSQYCPIFGGIGVIGRPWSPARQALIGSHVVAFAGLLILMGAGIPAAMVYLNNPPGNSSGGLR